MIFKEREDYFVSEQVRDIPSRTLAVELEYRTRHKTLRDVLAGFEVTYARGYEAILQHF